MILCAEVGGSPSARYLQGARSVGTEDIYVHNECLFVVGAGFDLVRNSAERGRFQG